MLVFGAISSLPNVLQVTTVGVTLAGAVIGGFVKAAGPRQFFENLVLGGGVGLLVGGGLGFGLWAGARLYDSI